MWNGSKIEIELILLRHGLTPGNQQHRYIGRTDESLSDQGVQQIREVGRSLNLSEQDLILVSPMKRCKESAALLFGSQEQIEINEWREMDFGRYEGKNYEELKQDCYYQKWINSNGTLPFPEGESQEIFRKRCVTGMEYARQIIQKHYRKKRNSAVASKSGNSMTLSREDAAGTNAENVIIRVTAVVHGGTIMALMSELAGGSYYDYQMPNGSGFLCHLIDTGHEWKLVSMDTKLRQYRSFASNGSR